MNFKTRSLIRSILSVLNNISYALFSIDDIGNSLKKEKTFYQKKKINRDYDNTKKK